MASSKLFPVACNRILLLVFSNIATYLVASITYFDLMIFSNIAKYLVASINENCPISENLVVGIFKHCHVFGGFNDLNVPVAGNLVVFSNSAKYWVRGLQSCGIFKHCKIFGGFNK